MFTGFTRQEQRVLVVLVLVITLGLGVHHYKSRPARDFLIASPASASAAQKDTPAPSKKEEPGTRAVETTTQLININTATVDELCLLRGIGPAKAKEIINYRSSKPFETIEELMKVKGIGKATFEGMRDKIYVGERKIKKDLEQKSAPTTTTQTLAKPKKTPAPAQPAPAGKININTATLEQLMTLEGIGEVKAKRIIEYREQNGPFGSTSGIKKVKGFGEKTFLAIQDKITVGK